MPVNYDNIPEEMRWDSRWALAGPDDTGAYKAPHGFGPKGPFRISPTQDIHLRDMESVVEAAQQFRPCGIGYMLSSKVPYTCIDLDIKNELNEPDKTKWSTQEQITRFWSIIKAFDSYTERSASGQGYHIWVRGKIGTGCKRDGVEVYSQERFIVCTGDVVVNKDIENRQDLLEILVREIQNAQTFNRKIELKELEDTESDETIMERARKADNSEKFNVLFSGDWNGYPSQSEADLALMSIFAFYTKSNAQCRRLFRNSGLGQRQKATKNDRYLNETLRLIRGREVREEKLDDIGRKAAQDLIARLMPKYNELTSLTTPNAVAQAPAPAPAPEEPVSDDEPLPLPSSFMAPQIREEDFITEGASNLPWPPGVAGEIAHYVFQTAPRPVKEVAIVAAIGLLAGICGKSYIIPQSGLNVYLVLVAQSAIGKEAMHSGISSLTNYVAEATPEIMKFIDFADYASGPALTKAVVGNQCFLNISGEWGRKLRRLGMEDGRDGPMQQLRTVMTNLYQKSGPKSIVGGISYSDKEKNVSSVSGVAYSMIGETTPRTFYDALTETMMEDGFLSRFTIVEYNGSRPPANTRPIEPPNEFLMETMCQLASHADAMNMRSETILVKCNPEAQQILDEFDKICDSKINGSEDEGFRQMWNRAHLKAFRIAALLAAADNHVNPIITKEHTEWALLLIRKDIAVMSRRINSGDVGIGDAVRERKVLSIIKRYLEKEVPDSYGCPPAMREEGIIPRKYIQINTQRASSFSNHKAGQNVALDNTLRSLMDSGYIQEFPKDKAVEKFNFLGKCYRVITLPLNTGEDRELKQNRKNS